MHRSGTFARFDLGVPLRYNVIIVMKMIIVSCLVFQQPQGADEKQL